MTEQAPSSIQWFTDARDARRYLGEIGTLWSAWMITMASLLVLGGWLVIVAGVLALVGLIALARPLQRRAGAIASPELAEGAGRLETALGRATPRDRAFRKLLYGKEPLEAAVEMTSSNRWLLPARWAMLGMTFLALLVILFGRGGSPVSG